MKYNLLRALFFLCFILSFAQTTYKPSVVKTQVLIKNKPFTLTELIYAGVSSAITATQMIEKFGPPSTELSKGGKNYDLWNDLMLIEDFPKPVSVATTDYNGAASFVVFDSKATFDLLSENSPYRGRFVLFFNDLVQSSVSSPIAVTEASTNVESTIAAVPSSPKPKKTKAKPKTKTKKKTKATKPTLSVTPVQVATSPARSEIKKSERSETDISERKVLATYDNTQLLLTRLIFHKPNKRFDSKKVMYDAYSEWTEAMEWKNDYLLFWEKLDFIGKKVPMTIVASGGEKDGTIFSSFVVYHSDKKYDLLGEDSPYREAVRAKLIQLMRENDPTNDSFEKHFMRVFYMVVLPEDK